LVLIDRDGAARFDPESLSGQVSALGTNVGSSTCDDNWPGADYGASATVRAGTIDASGRFSGWSEPVRLQFPEEDANGCACRLRPPAPRSHVPLAAILGLLVCARARRSARLMRR
jgi:hypothetical protein